MAEESSALPPEKTFQEGPMALLTRAVKNSTQILINCRNNRKLLAHVRAFDRHMNMVLENVQEMWTEVPRGSKGKKAKPINRERHIPKLFVRGDSVIIVMPNPK